MNVSNIDEKVKKQLSICIPSYNRPDELERLLNSIDASDTDLVEIVIREDNSPKRKEIRSKVERYRANTFYDVVYIENESNYGYDKNIRSLAQTAQAKWVMFMGDDDVFVEGGLDKYLSFLKKHDELGYVLRRYQVENFDGQTEEYRFADKHVFLEAGQNAIVEFFRRSVFISGFTYRNECFNDYECEQFDGTLLFQLYIQATACLNRPSAYCDILITKSIEGGTPFFGVSEAEKDLYESGVNTLNNSINFLKQVRVLTEGFDKKNGTTITPGVLKSYSKYSYGYLHEHRDDGIKVFIRYAKEVKRIGMGNSVYFYVYFLMLLLLGKRKSQNMIRQMKKLVGKTPHL